MGAQRIELCADALAGGTTPAYGTIELARRNLNIPIYSIIRPREGDFQYDENEFDAMMIDVLMCKKLGCDGVVTGILLKDGQVDKNRMSRLIEAAYPLGVTFHRAFDWTPEPYKALEDIITLGCERILTSGQKPDALSGSSLIADLIAKADQRIIIMPGSGIRASNISELAVRTKAEEYHSSAKIKKKSSMDFFQDSMAEQQEYFIPDTSEIKAMLGALNGLR